MLKWAWRQSGLVGAAEAFFQVGAGNKLCVDGLQCSENQMACIILWRHCTHTGNMPQEWIATRCHQQEIILGIHLSELAGRDGY